jgi:hypothetical protein
MLCFIIRTSSLVLYIGDTCNHCTASSSSDRRKFAHEFWYYSREGDGPRSRYIVQRIATEGPWAAFDESKAGFVSQEPSGGECIRRVEAWRVQRRSARERGQAGRSEPAAHIDREYWQVLFVSHIQRRLGMECQK